MRLFTLAKSRKVAVELARATSSKIDASEAPRVALELPQRPLAHSGAVLTWARVGGTELRVGAPAPARGERGQARPEPPPQESGAYAFEATSAPMIVSTRRGSPDAVPTSSDRACTSSAAVYMERRKTRGIEGSFTSMLNASSRIKKLPSTSSYKRYYVIVSK